MSSHEELDTPDTVYECPVCECGIKLKKVASHMTAHVLHKQVNPKSRPYVLGLLEVAAEICPEHEGSRLALHKLRKAKKKHPKKKPQRTEYTTGRRAQIISGGAIESNRRKH